MGIKALLRRRIGLWVLLELRNYVTDGWRVPRLRSVEAREVRAISRLIGPQPYVTVAVIMPTYRRNAELRTAITSVLKQDLTDFRIFVVDDGGGQTDDLPEDERLVVTRLSKNSRNLGMVRNIGVSLSRSTYVAFLDDDNTWYENHLAETIAMLNSSGAGMAYTAVDRFGPHGHVDTLSRPFDPKAFRDEDSWIDANSLVCRRSESVRFSLLPRSKKTIPKEDWRFVFDMSRRSQVAYLATPTVAYHINPDSYYTDWR